MSGPAALVSVDWGTSSFRAVLVDSDGGILDRRAGPHGIMSVKDGGFAGLLLSLIGDWLATTMPVIMSGMIGSRQGWVETPYVTAPASPAELAAGLVPLMRFERADVRVVPGVETAASSRRDVMRGEECQVFGALAALRASGGRFVLPGTHSKWVLARAGKITEFATYMTGEIFAALRDHTILGALMEEGTPRGASFARGVREGARRGASGALLKRLFGVRTAGLFGDIAGPDLGNYLSGMLIGAEIADASIGGGAVIHIIASDALAERYRAAGAELGVEMEVMNSECVVLGHLAIARLAGLLGPEGAAGEPRIVA
jgi:2-dehydro-3-deoxygalactonokinase